MSKKTIKTKKSKSLPYWTKWVNFGFSVSSFLVIIVAYCTLLEIRKQRLKSLEPELRILSSPFGMDYDIDNFNHGLITFRNNYDSNNYIKDVIDINNGKESKEFIPYEFEGNEFFLQIVNAGKGPAFDIKINYEFDTLTLLKHLNIARIDTAYVFKGLINIVFKGDTITFRDFNFTEEIQFMPEMYNSQDTFKIYLPETYFKLSAIRNYCLGVKKFKYNKTIKI